MYVIISNLVSNKVINKQRKISYSVTNRLNARSLFNVKVTFKSYSTLYFCIVIDHCFSFDVYTSTRDPNVRNQYDRSGIAQRKMVSMFLSSGVIFFALFGHNALVIDVPTLADQFPEKRKISIWSQVSLLRCSVKQNRSMHRYAM